MAIILPPQPWTRQPQIPVALAGRYAHPNAFATVADIPARNNRYQNAPLPRYTGGGCEIRVGPGGRGLYSEDGWPPRYWETGKFPWATYGTTWVIQFSTASTVGPDWIAGEVDNTGGYIEDLMVNSAGEGNSPGSLEMTIRDSSPGNLRRGNTGNIGVNDGRVHTVVWQFVDASTFRCWVDGTERALTYPSTGSVLSSTGTMEFPQYLMTRNLRGATDAGSDGTQRIYLYARLPNAPGGEASLSANPWQLFAPLPRRIFVGPGGAAGSYTLTALAGSYALTGQNADLLKSNLLTASTGSYSLTGQTATLTYAAAGSYILTALAGSYALTGQNADLLKSNVIVASNGSYSLTGQTATLTYATAAAYTLTALAGSYALNGQNATLTNSGEVIVAAQPQVGIDWGALVQKTWGKEYTKPEYQYEFSNGRRFLEKKNPYS